MPAPDIPGAVAPGYPGKWTIFGENSLLMTFLTALKGKLITHILAISIKSV